MELLVKAVGRLERILFSSAGESSVVTASLDFGEHPLTVYSFQGQLMFSVLSLVIGSRLCSVYRRCLALRYDFASGTYSFVVSGMAATTNFIFTVYITDERELGPAEQLVMGQV